MLEYKICHLKQHKQHIEVCASWAYSEWGRERGTDFQTILHRFTEGSQTEQLPLTLIAINKKDELPIGMISLWKEEKGTSNDLSPWLASLYVSSDFRGNSVGTKLVSEIEKKAMDLGYSQIYLQTDEALHYYPRLGYEPLQVAPNQQTIFRKKLR